MKNKTFLGIVGPQVTLYGQTARPQPPMGLAYILGEVERAGWEPVLFDSLAEGYDYYFDDKEKGIRVTGLPIDNVIARINQVKPDVIGVSLGLSTDHNYVGALVREIKDSYNCPVVLGGSEASLMHRELFEGLQVERIPVDFVVTGRDIGSGEGSISPLLKAIEGKRDYETVPGLSFKKDGKFITTNPTVVTKESLAGLQLPRRDLFARVGDIDIYSEINQSHTGPVDYAPYGVLHTSRGCGGNCTFCHTQYNGFDKTLIRRSLGNISFELKELKDNGVQTVSIEDDNFGGFSLEQTEIAVEVLEEIERLRFKGVYFPNGMTVKSMINGDYAILRQLRGMADLGIKVRNSLPIESGDDGTLRDLIRKPHDLDMVQTVLDELKKGYLYHENIDIDTFFMVGVVGYDSGEFLRETEGSIQRTFDLADIVSDLGMRVNIWWMKPNPNGPQYKLWRQRFPDEPFYKLQFSFTPGIWDSPEEEARLNEQIQKKNSEMEAKGAGSMRPIYPVK
ncbi:MAG: B12-binding domain-containing radical SAM protein [Nanoarchaeota archaeon]|nr:B12-binding domain-containing radical SAM protein [Nanoarchaeota archaeon]